MTCRILGLSPATLRTYSWALTRLTRACPQLPESTRELIPVLADETLSLESKRDLSRAISTFFRWVEKEYKLPLPKLPKLPRRKLLPRVLSNNEADQLLDACTSRQETALILLALDTGLRLGEIASLTWPQVHPAHLRVNGKVGHRQVDISPETIQAMVGLGDSYHIWYGRKGPLTTSGVRQAYERLFYRAGIGGHKSGPHTLRHTFATWFIRAGGSVAVLQCILGHTDVKTTMVYVHLAGVDVTREHRQFSPIHQLIALRKEKHG